MLHSAAIEVRGTLWAVGMAAQPVVFQSIPYQTGSAVAVSATGSATIAYAKFTRFGTGLQVSCCGGVTYAVSDAVFFDNLIGIGGYTGT